MSKKGKNKVKNDFNIPLVIEVYLVLDIILLFILCLLELKGIDHIVIYITSLILEVIATIIVAKKSNIKTMLIFYIILLVSPVFLSLIAMGIHFISGKTPFTATLLVLFRNGYTMNGTLTNRILSMCLMFRIPALMTTIIFLLINLIKKNKKAS